MLGKQLQRYRKAPATRVPHDGFKIMTPPPSHFNPADSQPGSQSLLQTPHNALIPLPVPVFRAHLPWMRLNPPLLVRRRRCSRHGRLLPCDGRQLHRFVLYWWRNGNVGILRQGRCCVDARLQVVPIAPRRLSWTRSPFNAGQPAAGVAGCVKVFARSSISKYSDNGERPDEASEKDQ